MIKITPSNVLRNAIKITLLFPILKQFWKFSFQSPCSGITISRNLGRGQRRELMFSKMVNGFESEFLSNLWWMTGRDAELNLNLHLILYFGLQRTVIEIDSTLSQINNVTGKTIVLQSRFFLFRFQNSFLETWKLQNAVNVYLWSHLKWTEKHQKLWEAQLCWKPDVRATTMAIVK